MHTGTRDPTEPSNGRIEHARSLLARAAAEYAPVSLASSMSTEDMVLIDLVVQGGLAIEVFVLDTGKLHPETHALIEKAQTHYGLSIKVFEPNAAAVEDFLGHHEPKAIYDSLDIRKACCTVRKLEPLPPGSRGPGRVDHRVTPRAIGHPHRSCRH